MKHQYGTYEIEPKVWELRDSHRHSVEVTLSRHFGEGAWVCPYYLNEEFETKRDAEIFGIRFGKDVIDGRVPNCSVK